MKTLSWPHSRAAAKERLRILVADDDTPFARRLASYLFDHGFETRVVSHVDAAKEIIEFWQPDTIFLDLLLPATNALSIFKFLNGRPLKKIPKVIVMSKQALPRGVEQMKKLGAADYLVKPFSLQEAFRAVNTVEELDHRLNTQLTLGTGTIKEMHLLNLFLKQATQGVEGENGLYNLMRMINLKVKGMRCSFVQWISEERGMVLASNDDHALQGLAIDLKKYPEVREVRRTMGPVVIPNVRQSDLMAEVRNQLGRVPFETVLLFPVFRAGQFFGVLSIRMQQRDPVEIFYVEKFGQVCSQIISLAIGTPGQRLIAE
ncbi:MAG: response regulator [Bdellovibrionales bacterium]|nr:response regulator [Bdellovibrionales bacterium]